MGSRLPNHPGEFWSQVAPADGQPGLALGWPVDCQAAMNEAVRRVERWIDDEEQQADLWVAFFIGRNEQETYTERVAFETAFLWRVQQRLMGAALPSALKA
ncbi:LasR-specific antiactivator QslA [Pseudomonas pseudonitroreducens]|uniref:LasR-specific antiactivator QslA n=1 Tax=Pseudomonas pseudonitroreducens TaxID=2892326 RepID=UPI001EEEF95E|nr:LasR-specific antiactivator QslA [Pseudomonas pseudonitroreducens]